jgi:hypothetical protein
MVALGMITTADHFLPSPCYRPRTLIMRAAGSPVVNMKSSIQRKMYPI